MTFQKEMVEIGIDPHILLGSRRKSESATADECLQLPILLVVVLLCLGSDGLAL